MSGDDHHDRCRRKTAAPMTLATAAGTNGNSGAMSITGCWWGTWEQWQHWLASWLGNAGRVATWAAHHHWRRHGPMTRTLGDISMMGGLQELAHIRGALMLLAR